MEIQHAYFSTNPGTRLENWNNEYMRLVMNPVEKTYVNVVMSNNDEPPQEETITEWEAETLLIPKPVTYETVVEALIRTRYTVSDEFGFLRQREQKPDEFEVYNIFVEECKNIAKSLNL